MPFCRVKEPFCNTREEHPDNRADLLPDDKVSDN